MQTGEINPKEVSLLPKSCLVGQFREQSIICKSCTVDAAALLWQHILSGEGIYVSWPCGAGLKMATLVCSGSAATLVQARATAQGCRAQQASAVRKLDESKGCKERRCGSLETFVHLASRSDPLHTGRFLACAHLREVFPWARKSGYLLSLRVSRDPRS